MTTPLARVFLSVFRFRFCDVFSAVDHCSCPQQAGHYRHRAAELLPGLDHDRMGGCAGVGGENGRAHGGAVSLSGLVRVARRPASLFWLRLVLVASFSLAACSRQNAPPAPDAATVLRSIAPADASKYPSLQESKHWSNPYLVIRADRVGLLNGIAANEEQILKPGEVLNALAQLPASAWPYGRAVAVLVDERPATSEAGQDRTSAQSRNRRRRACRARRWQSAGSLLNAEDDKLTDELTRTSPDIPSNENLQHHRRDAVSCRAERTAMESGWDLCRRWERCTKGTCRWCERRRPRATLSRRPFL